ncbi:hypothetical protein Acsp06_49800 [Actinomycetospora sp. NBRC 106375]|nr:hypothetical protein [Actinomycetospora sp. NBRC 106375]GLZ48795.1 hypothetical protein Acsp06_49800 [Actinomycetospora sp. NBRC 106375]
MSVEAPARPTTARRGHVHDRSCYWDVMECRWAGPAHPVARDPRVPAPR